MSFSVLYWSLIIVTYLAGVGTLAIIQWFRQPHPGTRVNDKADAEWPPPAPAAEPAPPRTLRHGYDTMDVLEAGWAARDTEQRPAPAPSWPAGSDDSAGWVSGPAGGNAGTWQPQPDRGGQ